MCLGVRYIHEECNHTKKFHVLRECNSVNGTACNNLTTIHVVIITAPALCIRCFRRKEATIDAQYETIRRELRGEIARVDEALATALVTTGQGSVALGQYRAECEDNIVQAKASRDLSIRMFRDEQGVWGDG